MSSWRSARMESEDPGLQLCCLIPSQEWDTNTHARANRQHSNVGAYKLGLYHRHFCWIFIIFHLSEGICWQGNINEYSYEWWRWQDLYYWTGFLQNQFQEPVKDLALCRLSSSTSFKDVLSLKRIGIILFSSPADKVLQLIQTSFKTF